MAFYMFKNVHRSVHIYQCEKIFSFALVHRWRSDLRTMLYVQKNSKIKYYLQLNSKNFSKYITLKLEKRYPYTGPCVLLSPTYYKLININLVEKHINSCVTQNAMSSTIILVLLFQTVALVITIIHVPGKCVSTQLAQCF